MALSKFTPEIRGVLIDRIASGLTQQDASVAAGITHNTFKNWMHRGRRGEAGYAEFAASVIEARNQAENRPEPLTEDEHRALVAEACRKGSVAALKLAWEMILADRNATEAEEPQADPLSITDELAARRAA